ncbi:hypothetical protein GEMRC1_002523 [Eukaryota sp. GEM-RC1]
MKLLLTNISSEYEILMAKDVEVNLIISEDTGLFLQHVLKKVPNSIIVLYVKLLTDIRRNAVINSWPFRPSTGLPSADEVRSLLQDNKPLTIEHFHEHWLINKVVEPIRRSGSPVVEPASVVLDTNHYLEQIQALPAQQQEFVLAQVRSLLESATNGPKEPSVVKKGRGRPKGSRNVRREPSAHEIASAPAMKRSRGRPSGNKN